MALSTRRWTGVPVPNATTWHILPGCSAIHRDSNWRVSRHARIQEIRFVGRALQSHSRLNTAWQYEDRGNKLKATRFP